MSRNPTTDRLPAVDLDRFGVRTVEAEPRGPARVAVIAARFNGEIVDRLVEGALVALRAWGVAARSITVVRVPGAWELPIAAAAVARAGRVDAIVALGCVLRGETSHYDVIVNESARGLAEVARSSGLPVTHGVLACDTPQQALARAGGVAGNKGEEAALAALEMAALSAQLGSKARPRVVRSRA
jgi:6,7-dimethyl-8-ribityllumazine synthase